MPAKPILILIAIVTAILARYLITFLVLGAIGLFFYGYGTLPLVLLLVAILFILATATLRAKSIRNNYIAVAILVLGAAAAIGFSILAATAVTFTFSRSQWLPGSGFAIIGIIYLGLAIFYLVQVVQRILRAN